MNTFPRWKYVLLIVILIFGTLYALPVLYGEDPAVQITGLKSEEINHQTLNTVRDLLKKQGISAKSLAIEENTLLVRFSDTEAQLKAKELIKEGLGEHYSVALNLAPVMPHWLAMIGARPMKLGLDLRGGVYFLMEVDLDPVIHRRMEGYYAEIPADLREAKLPYTSISKPVDHHFMLSFANSADRERAKDALERLDNELVFVNDDKMDTILKVALSEAALKQIQTDTLEQTISTLRNKVNELGVSEAVVQRHGLTHVVLELPGIQDTAYARDILGKTATVKFMLVDSEHDIQSVLAGHFVPGSKIYFDEESRPYLLKSAVVLTGDAITGATTGQDNNGHPAVLIRITGDVSQFTKTTRENVGRLLATVYVEVKDGKTTETVINAATINSTLGSSFQIAGLKMHEARDLALSLRSGAMPANVNIVEERIVGPSMGQDNIRMGMISVGAGLALVLIFMVIYYSVSGLVADLALLFNLILLLAIMSLIGATLTLPGIAGIVLTLGMAVDANVLIFERIREELRLGVSPQASIYRGFEYAFGTIVDSNLTTLIVGLILFSIGSGPVKGFAVTLCIGILTSMLTATMGSRALMNLLYGGRSKRRLRVGI